MKKINIALSFLFALILIFLIYRYSINDAWNKTENFVFLALLVLAPFNSAILIIQNKKADKEMNKPSAK